MKISKTIELVNRGSKILALFGVVDPLKIVSVLSMRINFSSEEKTVFRLYLKHNDNCSDEMKISSLHETSGVLASRYNLKIKSPSYIGDFVEGKECGIMWWPQPVTLESVNRDYIERISEIKDVVFAWHENFNNRLAKARHARFAQKKSVENMRYRAGRAKYLTSGSHLTFESRRFGGSLPLRSDSQGHQA